MSHIKFKYEYTLKGEMLIQDFSYDYSKEGVEAGDFKDWDEACRAEMTLMYPNLDMSCWKINITEHVDDEYT